MVENYYQTHGQEYAESTSLIDPSSFLEPFTRCLTPGARVLDVGCGSGRDLLWLRSRGFAPTGFEQSTVLAECARVLSDCQVLEGDFFCHDFSDYSFDGLLMVGAMVHVPPLQFESIFKSICRALRKQGSLYISLKEGKGTRQNPDGRLFYLWQREQLEEIFHRLDFTTVFFARSSSKREPSDIWLGYLLQKR